MAGIMLDASVGITVVAIVARFLMVAVVVLVLAGAAYWLFKKS